jgi:hypothetical protein
MFLEFFLLSMWKREFVCSLALGSLTGIMDSCIQGRGRGKELRSLLPGRKYSYDQEVSSNQKLLISLIPLSCDMPFPRDVVLSIAVLPQGLRQHWATLERLPEIAVTAHRSSGLCGWKFGFLVQGEPVRRQICE